VREHVGRRTSHLHDESLAFVATSRRALFDQPGVQMPEFALAAVDEDPVEEVENS
jgi:hypothetical protein